MSLLAAFAAMLGKQWLNRYSRHAGGSMIDRCGDRQRKFDGLQRWPFHFIIESLPVMLQIALLLLACGLCRYIMTINTPVAWTLIVLTGFGVLFYIVVIIAGASSYDCPFQTPGSVQLRGLWKKFGPIVPPISNTLTALGRAIWRHTSMVRSKFIKAHHYLLTLWEQIQLGILRLGFCLPPIGLNIRHQPQNPPLPTAQESSRPPNPHKAMVLRRNSDNIRCVSWVFKDITDPETLDAAIQLAGTIWWFEDGTDVKPVYDLLISTFDISFGSDGSLHQGLRNRAYYSGRAIIWIHALAACKSKELSQVFRFPARSYHCPMSDHDLMHLMAIFDWAHEGPNSFFELLLDFHGRRTPTHLQWTSNVLLHLSWAAPAMPSFRTRFIKLGLEEVNTSTPADILSNILLAFCHFLGSRIEKEALKIQDKSYGISCFCPSSHSHRCPPGIAWT